MTIQKLTAEARGYPLNSKGKDVANAVNQLIDASVANTVDIAALEAKSNLLQYSFSDEKRTATFNADYNTTNPQCKASLNTAGTAEYPNRLGHSVVFNRMEGAVLTTYTAPERVVTYPSGLVKTHSVVIM